jgi:hypothetical protein
MPTAYFETIVTITRPNTTVDWPGDNLPSHDAYVEVLPEIVGLLSVSNYRTDTESVTTYFFNSEENRQTYKNHPVIQTLIADMIPIMAERGITKTVVDLTPS